jgi:hypothetical protein
MLLPPSLGAPSLGADGRRAAARRRLCPSLEDEAFDRTLPSTSTHSSSSLVATMGSRCRILLARCAC